MYLAQQASQPHRALRPEAPSAAERHGAYPLGPHPAHQLHATLRRYLCACANVQTNLACGGTDWHSRHRRSRWLRAMVKKGGPVL